MRAGYAVVIVVAALTVAGATRLAAQSCSAPGYPVSVAAADGQALDSAFLADAAQAVAQRWVVPSARRNDYVGWRRVRERTVQAIPRWADDWRPGPTHKAQVVIVLRKRGRPALAATPLASGDAGFDRSLESVLRDPMPGSPDLPAIPASVTADSVALLLSFGVEPDAPRPGVLRFASAQTPVEILGNSLQPRLTRTTPQSIGARSSSTATTTMGDGATLKYDVLPDGRVEMSSVEVVDGTDRELVRAVREALPQARFAPATTNCQPVRLTVVQRFGGS